VTTTQTTASQNARDMVFPFLACGSFQTSSVSTPARRDEEIGLGRVLPNAEQGRAKRIFTFPSGNRYSPLASLILGTTSRFCHRLPV
jgi:hypothetical protein